MSEDSCLLTPRNSSLAAAFWLRLQVFQIFEKAQPLLHAFPNTEAV